ncbi:hypothetical protein HDV57DRAFT_497971 [Trichoderma longibrachiatum]
MGRRASFSSFSHFGISCLWGILPFAFCLLPWISGFREPCTTSYMAPPRPCDPGERGADWQIRPRKPGMIDSNSLSFFLVQKVLPFVDCQEPMTWSAAWWEDGRGTGRQTRIDSMSVDSFEERGGQSRLLAAPASEFMFV